MLIRKIERIEKLRKELGLDDSVESPSSSCSSNYNSSSSSNLHSSCSSNFHSSNETQNSHSPSSAEGRISIGSDSPSSSVNQAINNTPNPSVPSVQSPTSVFGLELEDSGGSPLMESPLDPFSLPLEFFFWISLFILLALGLYVLLIRWRKDRLFLFAAN